MHGTESNFIHSRQKRSQNGQYIFDFVLGRKTATRTLDQAMDQAVEIARLWPDSEIDYDDGAGEQWISIIVQKEVVALVMVKFRFGFIKEDEKDPIPSDFLVLQSLSAAEINISKEQFALAFDREPPDGLNLNAISALDIYALTAT